MRRILENYLKKHSTLWELVFLEKERRLTSGLVSPKKWNFFLMTWNFWKVIWIKKRKKLLYLEWRDWKIIQFLQWKFCIVESSSGQIYWKVREKIHHCRYQATVAELLTTFKRKKKAKIPLKPLNLEHMMYIHQTGISSKSCVLLMSLVMPT